MAQRSGVEEPLKDRVQQLLRQIKKNGGELDRELETSLGEIDPFALVRIEDELLEDGMTRQDLLLLCDARAEALDDMEEIDEMILERPGHPVHTLMDEHRQILLYAKSLRDLARSFRSGEVGGLRFDEVDTFLSEVQRHFRREENILFPYLEKHGIEGSPMAMWSEHEVLRATERELLSLVGRRRYMEEKEFVDELDCATSTFLALLKAHFHKENHGLFPLSIRALDVHEWNDIRQQFEDGIMVASTSGEAPAEGPDERMRPKEVVLPTGELGTDDLAMVLDALPIDITVIDDDDRVRYFSNSPHRIFARTTAVLGRKVQNCHPEKSVHEVQRIIDDLKAGTRDQAEFWIERQGRLIYIRYLPLRDRQGEHRGILEVSQDVTRIRELEGEKRLLDGT